MTANKDTKNTGSNTSPQGGGQTAPDKESAADREARVTREQEAQKTNDKTSGR